MKWNFEWFKLILTKIKEDVIKLFNWFNVEKEMSLNLILDNLLYIQL
jgi:hypothetical protein